MKHLKKIRGVMNLLTKEECEKALESLSTPPYESSCGGCICGVSDCGDCPNNKANKVLNQLIDEHFDNPPLKFEELKEGMFVWDNKHHTYILIDRIEETYNKTIYFYAIGWECCENTEFEPNRFYRKEVQE